jgi:hypothetical protein
MRTYRSKTGPFLEQPFFKPFEIESISRDELQKLDLYPSDPAPIRIDRFIEKRFGIQPTYEDLPNGFLGFTRFSAKGVEEIVVTKALDDEGTTSAERRLRTTLAHEAGHGLLHAHLFILGAKPASLFGDGLDVDGPKILCREGGVSGVGRAPRRKPPYRWWEFQANQAMGTLLLPKQLVERTLASLLTVRGVLDVPSLPPDLREEAVRSLADIFNVNPIVARIRLEAIFPAADWQLTL